MIKYIVFDLDGTLSDPKEGFLKAIQYALSKYDIIEENVETLYQYIGPPLKDTFMNGYHLSEEDALKAIDYYREYYGVQGLFENEMYEGIPEVLKKLKELGKIVLLATSKPESYATRILDHFDILKYFDYACGATMDGKISKKNDVISYALNKAGATDVSEVLMIGDTYFDVRGAKSLNIKTLGVSYGYGTEEELMNEGAIFVAKTPEEILTSGLI